MDGVGALNCACEAPPSVRDWLRIGLGLVISGQLMVLSLALNLSEVDPASHARIALALLALTAMGAALLGPELARATRRALARGDVSLEAMFALSLLGGLGASLWGLWRGGDVFFEVVTVVLAVHALGARLKGRFWASAIDRIERHWLPVRATRLGPDGEEQVALPDLSAGDRVRVRAGDRVPADGHVVVGSGWIDSSSLDGQLTPRPVGAGDPILGGALVVRGQVEIALEAAPGDGAHSRALLELLEAAGRELPNTMAARRVARVFAPVVATVALVAGVAWTLAVDLETGFRVGTAVLLVACPCGLGVATPVALWAAAAELGRRGVQVHRLGALEALARVRTVVLDKTGTLTTIGPEAAWRAEPGVDAAHLEAARRLVGAIEARIDHPVARALRRDGVDGIEVLEVRDVRGGVEVRAREGGRERTVRLAARSDARGVLVAIDGARVASVDLTERLADGAEALVQGLRERGLDVRILTGDAAPAPLEVPQELGLAPSQKAERVRGLRAGGEVLFVGDAANDLVAMAEADASATLGHAREGVAARVDLRVRHLPDLLTAIDRARATRRRLGRLLAGSLAANVMGVGVAAAGLLHPVLAAWIMSGTSLGVTLAAAPGGEDAP